MNGVDSRKQMVAKDCNQNPAHLTQTQLEDLGITEKMPTSLEQSLLQLEKDEMLRRSLDCRLIDDYVIMKRAEKRMIDEKDAKEQHAWLIERY